MAYAWAIVHNVIDPLIQQAYGVRVTRGRWSHEPYSTVGLKQACNDIFVSKYDAHAAGGMAAALSGISYHRDDQDFAFIVQLNDPSDFEGGGTVFEHYVGNDDTDLGTRHSPPSREGLMGAKYASLPNPRATRRVARAARTRARGASQVT